MLFTEFTHKYTQIDPLLSTTERLKLKFKLKVLLILHY